MRFRGTYTAVVTPFRNGRVDIGSYRKLLAAQRAAGVTGVVPCGSTGEAATLTEAERRDLIIATLDTVGDDLQVVVGTGTNSTASTITLTQEAERLGAHAAMIVAPYYNKPTQAGLFEHFRRVADATDLPLMVYNVPGRTAVTISAETVARLYDGGRYVAIKEAGGSIDAFSDIRAASGITVLSGDDSLTVSMMAIGAEGVVSVVSNLAPAAVREMVDAANEGDYERASELHFQLLPVVRAAFIESNPAPIKCMLSLRGEISDEVRPPLACVSEASLATIRRSLELYDKVGSF